MPGAWFVNIKVSLSSFANCSLVTVTASFYKLRFPSLFFQTFQSDHFVSLQVKPAIVLPSSLPASWSGKNYPHSLHALYASI